MSTSTAEAKLHEITVDDVERLTPEQIVAAVRYAERHRAGYVRVRRLAEAERAMESATTPEEFRVAKSVVDALRRPGAVWDFPAEGEARRAWDALRPEWLGDVA